MRSLNYATKTRRLDLKLHRMHSELGTSRNLSSLDCYQLHSFSSPTKVPVKLGCAYVLSEHVHRSCWAAGREEGHSDESWKALVGQSPNQDGSGSDNSGSFNSRAEEFNGYDGDREWEDVLPQFAHHLVTGVDCLPWLPKPSTDERLN